MRLLATDLSRFSFMNFEDDEIPRYAILSHRWGDDEVTFNDINTGANMDSSGWVKVQKFRQFARDRGYVWCWIDTCCIDKSSSAELSEAINSMFQWYKKATVCYAYLSDVSTTTEEDKLCLADNFKQSKWFTRGWTLQELLAPSKLEFVDAHWTDTLGTKVRWREAISEITNIPTAYVEYYPGSTVSLSGDLGRQINLSSHPRASVGQIMSWAANRKVTRIEDRAYSLLGLFDLSMPLLYGEGRKAFVRLQHEIIKASDDQSIFLWESVDPQWSNGDSFGKFSSGLLAPSPLFFARCDFVPTSTEVFSASSPTSLPAILGRKTSYELTQRGIRFHGLKFKRQNAGSGSDVSIPDEFEIAHRNAHYDNRDDKRSSAMKEVLIVRCIRAKERKQHWRNTSWAGLLIKYDPYRDLYIRSDNRQIFTGSDVRLDFRKGGVEHQEIYFPKDYE